MLYMMVEPFPLVAPKCGHSRRKRKKSASRLNALTYRFEYLGLPLRDIIDGQLFDLTAKQSKISESQTFIEQSECFKSTIDILKDKSTSQITNIVCFGIGRITRPISNLQLAYILALRSHLNIKKIQFYEPVLSNQEVTLLNSLDCDVYSQNYFSLAISRTTLVLLPHCPYKLTNNLLRENWSAASLHHLILICNSFRSIVDQIPISIPLKDASFINSIVKYTQECTFITTSERKDIFNDTAAIHFFKTENCEDNFFDNCVEPTELIQGAGELRLASPNDVGVVFKLPYDRK